MTLTADDNENDDIDDDGTQDALGDNNAGTHNDGGTHSLMGNESDDDNDDDDDDDDDDGDDEESEDDRDAAEHSGNRWIFLEFSAGLEQGVWQNKFHQPNDKLGFALDKRRWPLDKRA